jgi:hypothetical protein
MNTEDDTDIDSDILHKCYKEHRVVTRLTIRHANQLRYTKYGAALLQMFVKKPRDALKSILKTASDRTSKSHEPNTQHLSALRDPDTGIITNNPAEVIAIVEKIEKKLLSPDPNIDPNAPFPW